MDKFSPNIYSPAELIFDLVYFNALCKPVVGLHLSQLAEAQGSGFIKLHILTSQGFHP